MPTPPSGAPARRPLAAELPRMRAFEGRLGSSPATLADALELDDAARQGAVAALRLREHGGRRGRPAGRAAGHAAGDAEPVCRLSAPRRRSSSPNCCAPAPRRSSSSSTSKPRLAPFAFLLRDVVRRAAHTLSDAEEKLLADASPLASSATNIYTILSNADFPYPHDHHQRRASRSRWTRPATRRCGRRRTATIAGRRCPRSSASLGNFSRTFGTTMNSSVQKALFYSRAQEIRVEPRGGARRAEHSGVGLHAADRGRQPAPADLPSLPEAAARG